ncbi:hypothetical protein Mapa_001577 [Marchantia paleacea]|nr:hypothetical protein Mapa_001577 [Marchantia paleacea]
MESSSTSSSCSNDEGLMMGGRYISKEVVCKILGKLPVRNLLLLRCVCKRWNTILDDIEFQSISSAYETQNATSPASASVPYLLWDADSSRPLLSFDLQLRKWRPFHLLQSVQASVISSTRGLFLTTQQSIDGKCIYMLNPLTKTERQITSLDWAHFDVRQMVVDYMGLGQYFIIAEELQKRGTGGELAPTFPRIQIYDSLKKQWFLTPGFPEGVRFKNAFALNGHLLFLAQKHVSNSKNVGLYKFDGSESLEAYGLDLPVCIGPTFRQWIPRLFGNRGRLMLIGETDTCGRGVFIWQLNPTTYQWVLEHKMPNDLFVTSVGSYDFLACDDFICVHPSRGEKNRAIMGNLATNSWHILPAISPSLYMGRSAFIFDSFCFYEPRVGALV